MIVILILIFLNALFDKSVSLIKKKFFLVKEKKNKKIFYIKLYLYSFKISTIKYLNK